MTRLLLVRHGESTWNQTGRYQGRIDTELSELGHRQSSALAERLQDIPLEAAYSSPLRRSMTTAIYVATSHGLDLRIEPDLTEIDHGLWNGLLREEVEKRFGPLLQLWFVSPSRVQMPGGESLAQVGARAMRVISRILEAYPQGTVVLCSHDAVLRACLCQFLGLGLDLFWSLKLDNGSVSTLDFREGEAYLVCLNDTCHLGDLRSDTSGQAL